MLRDRFAFRGDMAYASIFGQGCPSSRARMGYPRVVVDLLRGLLAEDVSKGMDKFADLAQLLDHASADASIG